VLGVRDVDLIAESDAQLVIEATPTTVKTPGPALERLKAAFRTGKHVICVNKAPLAVAFPALEELSRHNRTEFRYSGTVGGGTPVLALAQECVRGNEVISVRAILNGTTNFILSRMDATGSGFDEALAEATALGYAEADPTADIDGFDAASKAAILGGLAFHTRVTAGDVYREGIGDVTAADIASAKAMGCTIKLLAICERASGAVSARVYPAMLPRSHPLAAVGDAFNAVFVEADAAGSLMFYGRGAGGAPSASAVLGDVVAVARNRRNGSRGTGESAYAALPILPMGDVATRYHVALDVADRPGVLAGVAGAFAEQQVSIQTVRQEGRGDAATLVIVTHSAADAALAKTVDRLTGMDFIRGVASVMRVEGMPGE